MSMPGIDTVLASAHGRYAAKGNTANANPANPAAMTRENAEQFEAVFLNTMFQTMFAGLEEGGTWGSDSGSEAWSGMLVEQYANTIAKAGGIGIADAVQRELLSLQETAGQ